ncbi:MAG TPA: hypothetical protein VGK67_11850 [Myxococcales bacterium]|jgi:hypothetical protein
MSCCPDRFALFVGLEENDPAIRAHVECCACCKATAAAERDLDLALGAVCDPAPPAELLSGVLARVDESASLAARSRRQTIAILGSMVVAFVGGLAALGPAWLVHAVLDSLGTLGSLRTVVGALGRSLGPHLSGLAFPLLAAQLLALLAAALLFNRLVAARVRSSP